MYLRAGPSMDVWQVVVFVFVVLGTARSSEASVPVNDRIDCHPRGRISESDCISKGCLFDPTQPVLADVVLSKSGPPSCYVNPSSLSYVYKSANEEASKSGWNVMKKNLVKVRLENKSNISVSGSLPSRLLDVEFERMSTRVMGFRIKDAEAKRYEVPKSLINLAIPRRLNKPFYRVEYSSKSTTNFAFKIIRESSNVTIFDTSLGGLTFEDQYLQIVSKLPSTFFYGFGSSAHDTFRHKFDWSTSLLFSRDAPLAGVHPFYMVIEENGGNAHGIFLLNSNAIEYKLQPSPALTIRAYGGVLDFVVCMGSTPNDVMIEYLQVVGRPTLPPFWALGFHETTNANKAGLALDQYKNTGIPLDVLHIYEHSNGISPRTASNRGWGIGTAAPNILADVRRIQSQNVHAVKVLPPYIRVDSENQHIRSAYEDGLRKDIFVKWPVNEPNTTCPVHTASAGPSSIDPIGSPVAFVDFFQEAAQNWWKDLLVTLQTENLQAPWDGIWLEGNQPYSSGTNGKGYGTCIIFTTSKTFLAPLDCPATCQFENIVSLPTDYRTGKPQLLSDNSLCMIVQHRVDNHSESHYNLHNLYGLAQATAVKKSVQGINKKRGLVVSESSFASSGKVSASWLPIKLGRTNTLLKDTVRRLIVAAFEHNMFGVTTTGVEVHFPPESEPYRRALQVLNIFHVMPRSILNQGVGGYPDSFSPSAYAASSNPSEYLVAATKKALQVRFSLLPYLYSLFFHGWMEGEPIIRPLFFEYSTNHHDVNILDVDDQFLWGPAVLFVPHSELEGDTRDVYLPNDVFYRYGTQKAGQKFVGGARRVSIDIPESEMGVFLRAGYIVPGFIPGDAKNTLELRTKPLKLLIASSQLPDGSSAAANGNWFWDDGDSIETIEKQDYLSWFIYNRWQEGTTSRALLDYDVERNDVPETSNMFFESFEIYGYDRYRPGRGTIVRLNGQVVKPNDVNITYQSEYQLLDIRVKIPVNESFKLEILHPMTG